MQGSTEGRNLVVLEWVELEKGGRRNCGGGSEKGTWERRRLLVVVAMGGSWEFGGEEGKGRVLGSRVDGW